MYDWSHIASAFAPRPAMFVLTYPRCMSDSTKERLLESWCEALEGTGLEKTKLIVIEDGMELEVICESLQS